MVIKINNVPVYKKVHHFLQVGTKHAISMELQIFKSNSGSHDWFGSQQLASIIERLQGEFMARIDGSNNDTDIQILDDDALLMVYKFRPSGGKESIVFNKQQMEAAGLTSTLPTYGDGDYTYLLLCREKLLISVCLIDECEELLNMTEANVEDSNSSFFKLAAKTTNSEVRKKNALKKIWSTRNRLNVRRSILSQSMLDSSNPGSNIHSYFNKQKTATSTTTKKTSTSSIEELDKENEKQVKDEKKKTNEEATNEKNGSLNKEQDQYYEIPNIANNLNNTHDKLETFKEKIAAYNCNKSKNDEKDCVSKKSESNVTAKDNFVKEMVTSSKQDLPVLDKGLDKQTGEFDHAEKNRPKNENQKGIEKENEQGNTVPSQTKNEKSNVITVMSQDSTQDETQEATQEEVLVGREGSALQNKGNIAVENGKGRVTTRGRGKRNCKDQNVNSKNDKKEETKTNVEDTTKQTKTSTRGRGKKNNSKKKDVLSQETDGVSSANEAASQKNTKTTKKRHAVPEFNEDDFSDSEDFSTIKIKRKKRRLYTHKQSKKRKVENDDLFVPCPSSQESEGSQNTQESQMRESQVQESQKSQVEDSQITKRTTRSDNKEVSNKDKKSKTGKKRSSKESKEPSKSEDSKGKKLEESSQLDIQENQKNEIIDKISFSSSSQKKNLPIQNQKIDKLMEIEESKLDSPMIRKSQRISSNDSASPTSPKITMDDLIKSKADHPTPEPMEEIHTLVAEDTIDLDDYGNVSLIGVNSVLELSPEQIRDLIREMEGELRDIFKGRTKCARHDLYHKGGHDRARLNMRVAFGLFTEDQEAMISNTLVEIFCSRKTKYFDYVIKVLLPESMALLYSKVAKISQEEAEKIIMERC